jgi:hypothetical protein
MQKQLNYLKSEVIRLTEREAQTLSNVEKAYEEL